MSEAAKITNAELQRLREDYSGAELSEASVPRSPFELFVQWFGEAERAGEVEPNAMILSTVGADGRPNSRAVLLKDFSEKGLTFFTNYNSDKAADIMRAPGVGLIFFWPNLSRQVRISGAAGKTSRKINEEYFATRPRGAQIGAWASAQSAPIEGREILQKRISEFEAKFSSDSVPCPEHWGGFLVTPDKFEFWQGRESRLHDRVLYALQSGAWRISRLSP